VKELFRKWDNAESPGCSIAVIQNGEFIFKGSFGMADLEHGIPLAPDSMFYACSVSKQFVAMCALLLEEEGKLSLDDNIRLYLTDFPDYGNPITIRHLLHHTSGIRDYFALWQMAGYDFQDYMPDEAVYQLIRRQKNLNFQPGEQHLYSNSCYFLLYRIIEKVSGTTLREYADKNLFKPLGMKNSFFHDDYRRLIKKRAMGYYPSPEYGFVNMISRFDRVGSGGMFTCLEDFLPWDRNFYKNQLGKKDQALVARMIQSGKLNSGREIGYGFALVPGVYRGLDIVEHSGSLGGYRTHYLRFPGQKFSVVILSNLSSFDPLVKTREIADIYLKADFQEPSGKKSQTAESSLESEAADNPENQTLPVVLMENDQKEYSGDYYSEELDCVYKIFARHKNLGIKVRYNPEIKMKKTGEDRFEGTQLEIRFKRDESGRVVSFSADSEGVKKVLFEKMDQQDGK
jgi:CubicO group peptidase (beta-lactamase class C family)